MIGLGRGYLVIGRRVPLRFHWTIPLGALVLGGFELRPWFWLAFLVLTLIHELGHALLVWRFRLTVTALDVHGFGGLCHWRGVATPFQDAAIAWGGVLAEAALLVVALVLRLALGPPTEEWSAELYYAFTKWNLWMIALNLLPMPPLDGATAWKILPLLRARWEARKQPRDLRWEVKRRLVAARKNESGASAEVFELEKVRDERQRKALADVDAEIKAIVDRAHETEKNRLN